MAVSINEPEAKLILDLENKGKIKINWKRLEIQKRFTSDNWYQLKEPKNNCIFLNDNICMIYNLRPCACRAHFSIEHPIFCDIKKHQKKEIGIWFPVEARMIVYALNIMGNVDYMPNQLLKFKKEK